MFSVKNEDEAKAKVDYWFDRIKVNYNSDYSAKLFREAIEVCSEIQNQITFDAKQYLYTRLINDLLSIDHLDLELCENIIIEYALPSTEVERVTAQLNDDTQSFLKQFIYQKRQVSIEQNLVSENTINNIRKHQMRNKIFLWLAAIIGVIYIIVRRIT